MGSRSCRNGSCQQTATNKYHSDIGSRLAEAFLTRDKADSIENTFCMLTIDTRHRKRLKDSSEMPHVRVSSKTEDTAVLAMNIDTRPFARPDSACRTAMEQETFFCWKLSLRKQFSKVLFQKRHTCCRCKRRSRSCVRNKTFNGIEKHYTCYTCREASKAVHHLFGGQSRLVQSGFTPSSLLSSTQEHKHTVQQTSDNAGHKDSGYETGTSCCTVASSCSASTVPGSSNLRINKSISAANNTGKNGPDLWSKANTKAPVMGEPREQFDEKLSTSCVPPRQEFIVSYAHSNNDTIKNCANLGNDVLQYCVLSNNDIRFGGPSYHPKAQAEPVNKTTEVSNILVADHQNCTFGVIRQINQRRIDQYDGYLPEAPTSKVPCHDCRDQMFPNATHLEASVQRDCYTNNKLPGSVNNNSRSENQTCYTCDSTSSKVFFRLPWEGGFVCEDCLDRLH